MSAYTQTQLSALELGQNLLQFDIYGSLTFFKKKLSKGL